MWQSITTSKNRAKARLFVIYASGWRVFDIPLRWEEINADVLGTTRNSEIAERWRMEKNVLMQESEIDRINRESKANFDRYYEAYLEELAPVAIPTGWW